MVIVAISNGGEENIIKNNITGDNVITENNGDQRVWEHPYFWVSPPTNRLFMHLKTQHFPNNCTRERPSDYCDVRKAFLCVVKWVSFMPASISCCLHCNQLCLSRFISSMQEARIDILLKKHGQQWTQRKVYAKVCFSEVSPGFKKPSNLTGATKCFKRRSTMSQIAISKDSEIKSLNMNSNFLYNKIKRSELFYISFHSSILLLGDNYWLMCVYFYFS